MICRGKGGGGLCDALVCHPGRSTNYKCCYSLHAMETGLGSGWMGGPPGSSTHLTHLLLIQALKSWLYNLIMRLRKVLKRTVAGGSEVWRSNNFCRSHISSSGRGKEFLANQALNVWSWKLRYWWVVKLSYWFSLRLLPSLMPDPCLYASPTALTSSLAKKQRQTWINLSGAVLKFLIFF